MIFRKSNLLGYIAASLGFISAHSALADDIPNDDLIYILNGIGVASPWHVDQISYEKQGQAHWQIDVYNDPKQVDADICVANETGLIVSRKERKYFVEGKQSGRVATFDQCEDAWARGAQFATLVGHITDEQLLAAIHAALAVNGSKSRADVKIESAELQPLLRSVNPNHIHSVAKQGSDITLSFWSKEIFPAVLAVQVQNNDSGPIYVYREN